MDVMEQIVDRLSIFKNLYDIIRIVDPMNKKVMQYGDDTIQTLEDSCFKYWKRNSSCQNCVSMRAFLTKETCIRLEYKEEKVYFIIASPVSIGDNDYIVEMLKDISAEHSIVDKGVHIHNVENFVAEMNTKVVIDEITGVYNRRYLSEKLPVDLNVCMQNNQPISLIALDLDLFSDVNKAYGYKAGDKILREVAEVLLFHRENDKNWIAKYGGDKFITVLNNYNEKMGYNLAEDIRKTIEKTDFEWEGDLIKITASLTVRELKSVQTDMEELLHQLKDGIYKAKSHGRNITAV